MEKLDLFAPSLNLISGFIDFSGYLTNFNPSKEVDKELNQQAVGIFKNLNIYFTNEKEFIEYSTKENTYLIIAAILNYRGLLAKWHKTLFSIKDAYEKSVEELFIETMYHYFTTYGVEVLEEILGKKLNISYYIPNKDFENFSLSDINLIVYNLKIKTLYERINLTFIKNKEEFLELHIEKIINTNKRLILFFPQVEYIFQNLNKQIEIDIESIKLKENKIFILRTLASYNLQKIKLKNLSPDTVIRFILSYITGRMFNTLSYTKAVKQSNKKFLKTEEEYLISLISDMLLSNQEKFLKLYKQKRKLINKILALLNWEKYLSKYEGLRHLYAFRYNKNFYKSVKTKYSMLNEYIEKKDIDSLKRLIKDYPELYQNEFYKLLPFIVEHKLYDFIPDNLTLKSYIQVYNYIKSLKEFNFANNNKYLFLHNGKGYTTERVLKNIKNSEDLDIIADNLKKKIIDEIYNKVKDKKVNVNFDIFTENEKVLTNTIETYIYLPKELEEKEYINVGIYWEEEDDRRIDLDLSAIFISEDLENIEHVGWNNKYKLYDSSYEVAAFFSGDITSGKNGASEFIFIDKTKVNYRYIVFVVAYYNIISEDKIANYILGINSITKEDLKTLLNSNSFSIDSNIELKKKFFNPQNFIFSEFKSIDTVRIIGMLDLKTNILYTTNIVFDFFGKTFGGSFVTIKGRFEKTIKYLPSRIQCNIKSLSFYDIKPVFEKINTEEEIENKIYTKSDLRKLLESILIS